MSTWVIIYIICAAVITFTTYVDCKYSTGRLTVGDILATIVFGYTPVLNVVAAIAAIIYLTSNGSLANFMDKDIHRFK